MQLLVIATLSLAAVTNQTVTTTSEEVAVLAEGPCTLGRDYTIDGWDLSTRETKEIAPEKGSHTWRVDTYSHSVNESYKLEQVWLVLSRGPGTVNGNLLNCKQRIYWIPETE